VLKIIRRFGKHCGCHIQGEYVISGRFWKPYVGQAVGSDLVLLIGGAEERAAIQLEKSSAHLRKL
jgi:hypothetical protein